MANPSTFTKTKRDGVLVLFDNAGYAGSNIYAAEARETSFSALHIPAQVVSMIRGRLSDATVRKGDDQPIEISFEAPFRQFTNGTYLALLDVLAGTGTASGWTKQDAKIEQWNLGARLTIEGTNHADSADHYTEWYGLVPTAVDLTEGDETVVAITLTCYRPDSTVRSGPT